MAVVTAFIEDQNFWEVNPQLALDPTFKAFRKGDKSRDKRESSLVMWWIAFCYDQDPGNKWRGQPLADKSSVLSEELLGSSDYHERHAAKLEPLIARYLEFTDTEAKRGLRDWEEKLQERRTFMKETKYTLGELGDKGWVGGTVTILDSMLKATKSMYDEYKTVLNALAQEDGEGHVQGGSKESLSDSGEI